MDEPFEGESGGQLRQKLEEALAAKAAMEAQVFTLSAEKVIGATGLKHVKPEDLVGVPLAELEVKAQEVEATKAAAAEALLKEAVKARGVSDDQIDQVLSQLLGAAEKSPASAAHDRLNQLGHIQGKPLGSIPDPVEPGLDRIKAGVASRLT